MVADHQGGEHQVGIINRRERRETSPPHILASGSGRCRAAGRTTHRGGANLSITAGAHLVGNPAGSAPDIVARLMGQWSSERPPALSGNGGTRARVESPGQRIYSRSCIGVISMDKPSGSVPRASSTICPKAQVAQGWADRRPKRSLAPGGRDILERKIPAHRRTPPEGCGREFKFSSRSRAQASR